MAGRVVLGMVVLEAMVEVAMAGNITVTACCPQTTRTVQLWRPYRAAVSWCPSVPSVCDPKVTCMVE